MPHNIFCDRNLEFRFFDSPQQSVRKVTDKMNKHVSLAICHILEKFGILELCGSGLRSIPPHIRPSRHVIKIVVGQGFVVCERLGNLFAYSFAYNYYISNYYHQSTQEKWDHHHHQEKRRSVRFWQCWGVFNSVYTYMNVFAFVVILFSSHHEGGRRRNRFCLCFGP